MFCCYATLVKLIFINSDSFRTNSTSYCELSLYPHLLLLLTGDVEIDFGQVRNQVNLGYWPEKYLFISKHGLSLR